MKIKFIVINKKIILIFLSLFIFVCSLIIYFSAIKPVFQPVNVKTIVIDAGHGGIDGGCVGISTKVKESDLNLLYAQTLQKLSKGVGLKVIMTRESEEGLYEPFAKNKKKSEMEKREKIIKNSNADLFVSVHMNSLFNKSLCGAQVFYKKGNEEAKVFADDITQGLKANEINIRGESKVGDYYVLNCHNKAGVLIECGFLSNEREEKMLQEEKYRQKFCEGVLKGVLNFLKE